MSANLHSRFARHSATSGGYLFGGDRRQAEGLELIDVLSRAVADIDNFGGEVDRGDGDHAFPGR